MGKINSRRKGADGEREAASALAKLGFAARRSIQNGVTDGRDIVVDDLPNVYFEIKRSQSVSMETQGLDGACNQARSKSKGKPWCVLWRRDRECWKLTFRDDKCGIVTVHRPEDIAACLKMLNAEGAAGDE